MNATEQYNSQPLTNAHSNNSINILQWNVNGVPEHWHELKTSLSELNSDIICLQESHIKPSDPYIFALNSYSFYSKDFNYHEGQGRRQGGVCTYVKNNIPHRVLKINTELDILLIEIHTNTTPITIVNFWGRAAAD